MKIKKSTIDDIPRIMEILNEGKLYLKKQGINQWQTGYPNFCDIEKDVELGYGFILMLDKTIVGCMALSFDGEKTYDIINGKWLTLDKYSVIHRIAIANQFKGKGYADNLLKFAEKVTFENNINSIKIDTHPLNISMQKWIEKNNFIKCGIVIVDDNTERYAYEKILK